MAGAVFVLLLAVLAFFAPYLLKRYVENHSEEWIGRKVTIGSIILNPFTRTFGLTNVTCREPKSEDRFVAWEKAALRWDLWALWNKGDWRFFNVELRKPYVHIAQNGELFNFSDLLEFAGDDKAPDPTDTVPLVFSMEDLVVSDGTVEYASDLMKAPISVLQLNASCTRITSASSRMDFDLDFALSTGGAANGSFMIDTEKELYGVAAALTALDLAPLLPYMQDIMDCSALNGSLDIALNLQDSWSDTTALALSTDIDLTGFELRDNAAKKLLAIGKAHCSLDTLTTKEALFKLRKLSVDGAYTRFEMYADSTDNWTRLLKVEEGAAGDGGSVELSASESNVFVMLADYIALLGKEFIANEYNADSVSFTNGTIDFVDNAPASPFKYTIGQLALHSSRVTTDQPTATMDCSALLNGSGLVVGDLVIDPMDFTDMTVTMAVEQLALRDLDPYFQWYAAHPVEDGVLAYNSSTSVRSGIIDSKNHLRVDRMRLGKKTDEHADGIYILPLRLAVGLLKDPKGVIELDVPVTGDLNDPTFKPWPIVWQVLKNLLLKAVSAPINLIARAVGGDQRDLEALRFETMQAVPASAQLKGIDGLARALAAKPDLAVDLIPLVDSLAEREDLAFFSARRMSLFPEGAVLSAADSARVLSASARDSSFLEFLNERSPTTALRPVRERCLAIAGEEAIAQQQSDIEYARRENTMQALLRSGVSPARVRFRNGTAEELATWKGVPGYRFIFDAADSP